LRELSSWVLRSSTVYAARARLAGAVTVLGLAVLGLALASPARAAELSFAGPALCGDVAELRYRVERALGSALADAPPLVLDVTIAQRARALAATLRVREEAGAAPSERRLEAEDCAHLLDALSVVIVLAIDRVRAREQAEPVRATPAATEPLPSAPPASPERADELATRAPSWRPSVLAWLAGDYGSLPDPDLGVGLGLSLDGTRARLQASGLFFFEQRTELAGRGVPPPGADVGLALAALSACYAPDGSWQSDGVLGVCARAELGRLFGRGTNVQDERSDGRLWVAPGLSLAGEWQVLVPALRLGVEAGAVLPLLRSEVRLGTLGELYRPAAVSARGGLGLTLVLE
jgi:hypothetical protein